MFWLKLILDTAVSVQGPVGDGHRRAAGPPKVGGVPPVSVCPPGPRPGGRGAGEFPARLPACAERGYGVELDVHLTGDGRLAVIHDKNLKRTAGVDAEVSGLSAAELKAFQLEDRGDGPLLEEVLPMFQGGPPSGGAEGGLLRRQCAGGDGGEYPGPVPGELLH